MRPDSRKLVAGEITTWSQRPEYEVDVIWSPACEEVSPEAEERSPLEAVTKQVTKATSLCVVVICKV
jgi:hypothetical protein